jgi:hypothetical protein
MSENGVVPSPVLLVGMPASFLVLGDVCQPLEGPAVATVVGWEVGRNWDNASLLE